MKWRLKISHEDHANSTLIILLQCWKPLQQEMSCWYLCFWPSTTCLLLIEFLGFVLFIDHASLYCSPVLTVRMMYCLFYYYVMWLNLQITVVLCLSLWSWSSLAVLRSFPMASMSVTRFLMQILHLCLVSTSY